MATSTQWLDLLDDIRAYYGDGSTVYADISKYGLAADEFNSAVGQLPGWSVVVDSDGAVTGYTRSLNYDVASQVGVINSNLADAEATKSLPSVATAVEATAATATAAGAATKKFTGSTIKGVLTGILTLGSVAASLNSMVLLGRKVASTSETIGEKIGTFVKNHSGLFQTGVRRRSGDTTEEGVPALIDYTDNQGFMRETDLAKIMRGLFGDESFSPSGVVTDFSNYYSGAYYLKYIDGICAANVARFKTWNTSDFLCYGEGDDSRIEAQVTDAAAPVRYVFQYSTPALGESYPAFPYKISWVSTEPFNVRYYSGRFWNEAGTGATGSTPSATAAVQGMQTFGRTWYIATYETGAYHTKWQIGTSKSALTDAISKTDEIVPCNAWVSRFDYAYFLGALGVTTYPDKAYNFLYSGLYFSKTPAGGPKGLYYIEGDTDDKHYEGGVTPVAEANDVTTQNPVLTSHDMYYCIGPTVSVSGQQYNLVTYVYVIVPSVGSPGSAYTASQTALDGTTFYGQRVEWQRSKTDYNEGIGFPYFYEANFIPGTKVSDSLSEDTTIDSVLTTFVEAYNAGVFTGEGQEIVATAAGGDSSIYVSGTEVTLDPDASDEDTITALRTQLPDFYSNRIEQTVVDDDGTQKTVVWYPVPWNIGVNGTTEYTPDNTVTNSKIGETTSPGQDDSTAPTTYPDAGASIAAQGTTQPEGVTVPVPINDTYELPSTSDPTTTPPATDFPDTGSGDTPTVVVPTVEPSALWTVYNPSLDQVNSFGAWLWSSNFLDQLLKIFSDPMSAIIGFHEIYATPTNGEDSTIHVGYLDSGIASKTVSRRYGTIDCGTVDMSEYFGNVFDYDPYTEISLYLPFIGFVPLATADVMRGTIGIKYNVDFYTGACLAMVDVQRDVAGGVLYQYGGNCAAQIPLSSGSYMGIVTGLLGIAGSVASGIATGGASVPLSLIAGAGQAAGMHTSIQHGGSFAGSIGAMGAKVPYLVISRPQVLLPDSFDDYTGVPSSRTVTIGNCSGFTRFDTVHLDGIPATSGEIGAIEDFLTGSGVII